MANPNPGKGGEQAMTFEEAVDAASRTTGLSYPPNMGITYAILALAIAIREKKADAKV